MHVRGLLSDQGQIKMMITVIAYPLKSNSITEDIKTVAHPNAFQASSWETSKQWSDRYNFTPTPVT